MISRLMGLDARQDESIEEDGDYDAEAIRLGHANIIAGACWAIGLKFAGTAHSAAAALVTKHLKILKAAKAKSEGRRKVDKPTIETCLGLVALSLSLVMAGSGDLDAFRQIRSLRLRSVDNDLTYGNHMAIGMALGFLFLGGGRGTLNTSNLAIAALVISLYPHFPLNSTDNRYHLQAARHMYVLAVQQRCLEVRDVDTRLPCWIPLQIKLKLPPTEMAESSISCMAPCVLPDLETISTIEVTSNRYWPVKLDIEHNAAHRRLLSSAQIVYVKRKTGHISYAQDPRGLRSIIARSVPGLTDLGAGRDEHSTAEFVQCFSEDPNMLAFARLFCSRMHDDGLGFAPNGASHSSVSDEHVPFCTNVLHECLAHDKPEILATYLSIYFHLRQLDAKPDVQVSARIHSATLRPVGRGIC